MTCIVGIADGNSVVIGGDSAGVANYDRTIRADVKVFKVGPMVMGFTSSFRMGQLLHHRLAPLPKHGPRLSAEAYLVGPFINAVRGTLSAGGWLSTDNGQEEGGQFLVGYRGRLYQIDSDFQVGDPVDQVAAIGCGESYALGALHATPRKGTKARIRHALEAACHYSAGVAPPFLIVEGGKR